MYSNRPSAASRVSRRALLQMAGVAGAGTLVPAAEGSTRHADQSAQVPPDSSPDQALQTLMDGNKRFMAGAASSPNRTLKRLQELGEKQAPFASILSCADSRVPLEILFDTGFGDMFVCRAAGNIATPQIIGSLEYGTLVLGSRILMVLGHTACGAVSATMKGDAVPGQIGSLYPYIYPAIVQAASKDINAVVAQNVRHQVDLLRHASPVIRDLTRETKLRVVGGVFDFHDGSVKLLEA